MGNLVRPESHPEPRGVPVQWADPGITSRSGYRGGDRPQSKGRSCSRSGRARRDPRARGGRRHLSERPGWPSGAPISRGSTVSMIAFGGRRGPHRSGSRCRGRPIKRREAGREGCLWPNAASQGRPPDGSGGESERSTPNGRAKTLWWWWWWWWWSGAHTTPNYLRQASQNLGKYHFKHSVLVPRIKRDRNLIPRLTIRGGDCTGLPPKSRRRLDNSSAGSLDPPLRA